MITFIFTLDYEIFGNGTGSLRELIYEPGEQLIRIFRKWNARFVNFVEVAELEKIEAAGTDSAIQLVTEQVRTLYREGFEIALHLHPQWAHARYESDHWVLDQAEYNLCTLPRTRITEIVGNSLSYLRYVLNTPKFTPMSFRAGNWLFQPTGTAAAVLGEHGIKIDSSVFKGGLQRGQRLDYRPALKNDVYWTFSSNVNQPDPLGQWVEVPIYTEMVPFWKMPTSKRLSFGNSFGMRAQSISGRLNRAADFLRFKYPLKLDFCRMTLSELTSMLTRVLEQDRREPNLYRPIVAIGHTKDLVDPETVDGLLSFLQANKIPVSTFEEIYPTLSSSQPGSRAVDILN